MQTGAPNYFISVSIYRLGAKPITFIPGTAWADIDRIPRPNTLYRRPAVPAGLIATVLPAHIPSRVPPPTVIPPPPLSAGSIPAPPTPPPPLPPVAIPLPPEPPPVTILARHRASMFMRGYPVSQLLARRRLCIEPAAWIFRKRRSRIIGWTARTLHSV